MPSADAAPSRTAAIARIPDPQPTSRTVRPSTPPRSASCSSAARQSRVVGCSPVPNAIPGSRARTTSPSAARCRRQVGRITSRRPTRSTGKCRFHSSAQSASSIRRVVTSPIGRRSNTCRWPRACVTSSTVRSTASGSLASTYARTIADRAGSTRAPSPSSTSSNPGSTLVPVGATRPRISLTASTASVSASTEISSQKAVTTASTTPWTTPSPSSRAPCR